MTPKEVTMPMDRPPERYIWRMKRLKPWLALTALFVLVYAVYLDHLNLTLLLGPYQGGAATSLATGLSAACLAFAIICRKACAMRHVLLGLGLVIAFTATVFPGLWNGLSQQSGFHGKMGFDTNFVITLLAVANLVSHSFYKTGAAMALAAFVILFNSMLGYSFGMSYLSGQMAFGSMIALMLLSCATLTLFLDFAPTRVVFLNTDIGHNTRLTALMGIAAPWACGMVLHHIVGVQPRGYPVEAMMVTVIIATGIFMAIRSGNFLERADEQRRTATSALEVLALTDPLTGLYNREGAKRLLRQRRLAAPSRKRESAVVFVDIDHFKTINDSYGHAVGDLVLKSIQPAIAPVLDKSDIITRWGGDEFMIYVEVKTIETLPALVEKVRAAVASLSCDIASVEDGIELSLPDTVTASFGVSLWDRSRRFETALERADIALYHAKHRGRNCIDCDGYIRAAARAAEAQLVSASRG